MSFIGNNYNPFQNNTGLEKILGGAVGAYYGTKNGNLMDGVLGGYAGFNKPTSLYDRIMDKYLPHNTVLTVEDKRSV